jgi:hypothetical protein
MEVSVQERIITHLSLAISKPIFLYMVVITPIDHGIGSIKRRLQL